MPKQNVRFPVTLDFSEEAFKRFDEIRALGGNQPRTTTIANALRVYEWVLKTRREGRHLEVVTPIDDCTMLVERLF